MLTRQSWYSHEERGHSRSRIKLATPVINTYSNQIEHCERLYTKLTRQNTHSLPSSPFRKTRFKLQTKSGVTPSGYRSAPPWCGRNVSRVNSSSSAVKDGRDSQSTTAVGSRPSTTREYTKIDPVSLSEYLKSRGYGTPLLVTSSHLQQRERTLPPGVQARVLPKNPSIREKVKGRARLDYELANIKAEAFCEQQKGRYFRTASANLRNRDVRFQEEELREQLHREQADQDDDDIVSIVASPLNREELFSRIQTWIQEVEEALERS